MRLLENWLYEKLGGEWCGNVSPPLDHRKMYTSDGYVVSLNNYGFETWIGSPDQWYWHTNNSEFRKIAWWAIRQHIFIDWFGLRSWLWYKLLHRECTRIKAFGELARSEKPKCKRELPPGWTADLHRRRSEAISAALKNAKSNGNPNVPYEAIWKMRDKGMSIMIIAKHFEISRGSVQHALRIRGLATSPSAAEVE